MLTSDSVNVLPPIEAGELRKDLILDYWRNTVDKLLDDHGIPLLSHHGHHSRDEMKTFVNNVYEEFDTRRKDQEAQQADEDDFRELESEIPSIKHRSQ